MKAMSARAAAARSSSRSTQQQLAMQAQSMVHNDQTAVRADDLLLLPGSRRERVRGSGRWQSLLPSAFVRVAFGNPAGPQVDAARHNKLGPTHAKQVQWTAATLCVEGQAACVRQLLDSEMPYAIFSVMMDETSFRLRCAGDPPEVVPVLALHGHLTWQSAEGSGVKDEDVVLAPVAMCNQAADCLWPALQSRCPIDLLKPFPKAQLQAICTGSDHAKAMLKVWKYLESKLPSGTFFIRGLCKQHATGLCIAPVTLLFDLLCPAFCSVKLLHQGHFHSAYMQGIFFTIQRSLVRIVAADSPDWRPDPADQAHAQCLLEKCYYARDLHAIHSTDEELSAHKEKDARRRAQGGRLLRLCPGNWRKKHIVHWCQPGCCDSFMESVAKVFDSYNEVMSQVIPVPAQNKWTQVWPVMSEVALGMGFHQVMPRAMEYAHTREQPEGAHSDDDAQEARDAGVEVGCPLDERRALNREKQKRSMESLNWFRSPDTYPLLLTWMSIVSSPMRLHYFLFRDSTSFLTQGLPTPDMPRPPIFDLVDTVASRPRRALSDLEALLLPSHPRHGDALRLLYDTFGASWPAGMVAKARQGALLVYGNVWRRLVKYFEGYPWRLARMCDVTLPMEERRRVAQELFDKKPCDLDPGVGQRIRARYSCVEDIFEPTVMEFLTMVFLRTVVSTAFVECTFAAFRQWVNMSNKPIGIDTLAGKYACHAFKRSHASKLPASRGRRKKRTRPFWVGAYRPRMGYSKNVNGWHVFVSKELKRLNAEQCAANDNENRDDRVARLQRNFAQASAAWRLVDDEQRKSLAEEARNKRACWRTLDPVAAFLREREQGEQAMTIDTPWGLGDDSWPLRPSLIADACSQAGRLVADAQEWTSSYGHRAQPDPAFPKNVPKATFCLEYLPKCRGDFGEHFLERAEGICQDLKAVVAPARMKVNPGQLVLAECTDSFKVLEFISYRKTPFEAEVLCYTVTGPLEYPYRLKLTEADGYVVGGVLPLLTEMEVAIKLAELCAEQSTPSYSRLTACEVRANIFGNTVAIDELEVSESQAVDLEAEREQRKADGAVAAALKALGASMAPWQKRASLA